MANDLAALVGRRIRARRKELHLKQRELATLIPSDAVDNQRVSDWERGVNKPSDRYMEQIAEVLDRPVAWFYEDDEPATPDLMAVLPNGNGHEAQLDRMERTLDAMRQDVSDLKVQIAELQDDAAQARRAIEELQRRGRPGERRGDE
jgi:transcriptional regulator with XRE-family HTH domain